MKKKSPRAIPDFAHHPRTANEGASAAPPATDRPTPRVAPPARVKPQSTSAKSGRRGQ
jgi:hypothetical protein